MSQGRRPFIDELHEAGRTEEDLYFAKRDRELIAKLRKVEDEGQQRHLKELAYMRCPDCGARLKRATHYGVTIEECPSGHGLWLTDSELHIVAKRERSSWLGRYFYWPKL